MNAHRRRSFLASMLVLSLLVACGWSWTTLQQSRRAAAAAGDDAAACRELARTVTALRQRPSLAGSQEMQMTELAAQIERATAAARLPAQESLVRISPEPARRLGDTPYKEKPTQLLFRQVTLRELIAFLHALTASEESGLQVRSLRLVAPREQETGDRWTAEVTLSYLIYAPASGGGGGAGAESTGMRRGS